MLTAGSIVVAVAVFALAASYGMYRASNRSAAWNVVAGTLMVATLALVLFIVTVVLVRIAFPNLW